MPNNREERRLALWPLIVVVSGMTIWLLIFLGSVLEAGPIHRDWKLPAVMVLVGLILIRYEIRELRQNAK